MHRRSQGETELGHYEVRARLVPAYYLVDDGPRLVSQEPHARAHRGTPLRLRHTGHVFGSKTLLRCGSPVPRRNCPVSRPSIPASSQSTTRRIRLAHEGLRCRYTRCQNTHAGSPVKVIGPSSATPV